MAVATVAARYAKSLLDLAQERNLTEVIHKDMQFFKSTVAQNRPLLLMMKNPIVRAEKKNAIIKAVFESRLHAMTMAFFKIIAKKNREAILDAIAEQFIIQYNRQKGIERATVVTTVPLTDALRQKFKDVVMKTTGGKVIELREEIDDRLIGGYVLRLGGDRQVDESLRSQLNDLRLQFLN